MALHPLLEIDIMLTQYRNAVAEGLLASMRDEPMARDPDAVRVSLLTLVQTELAGAYEAGYREGYTEPGHVLPEGHASILNPHLGKRGAEERAALHSPLVVLG